MDTCIRCGVPTNSPDNICDSCRNRNITLSKLYEFYEQTKCTEPRMKAVNNLINQYNSTSKAKSNWLIIWILTLLVSPVALAAISAINDIIGQEIYLGGILGIFVLIVMPILNIRGNRKFKGWKEKEMLELSQSIAHENTIIENIYNKSSQYVPYKYREPHIVRTLIQLIESNRADSLKEAINLYESIKYTDSMLSLQKEMSENARASAIANVATAVNTYGVYKNTRR